MKPKHLIIGGVAVLAIGLMSFARARISQGKELFKRILFKVSLPKRFDISTQRMRFYVDLMLQNPTAQDFLSTPTASRAKPTTGKNSLLANQPNSPTEAPR